MSIRQISVLLDDRPGTLAEMAKVLESSNAELRALAVADAKDHGIVRLLADDVDAAVGALDAAGDVCMLADVIAVAAEVSASGLRAVLEVLGELDVNVEYAYTLATRQPGQAYVVARVSDSSLAVRELSQRGWKCLQSEDLAAV